MRKFAIAATVGVMLLAGQALAASQASPLQVGDRVGPVKGSSKALFDDAIPNWVVYGGVVIAGFAAWAITNDSDSSKSP